MTRFAVTGPRPSRDQATRLREAEIVRVAVMGLPGVEEFTTGAQYGVDTEAFWRGVLYYREALHRLVIPQTDDHDPQDANLLCNYVLIRQATETQALQLAHLVQRIYVTGKPPAVYHRRNGKMLDFADVLLAFPRTAEEQARGSGTWACIRMARRRGMEIWFYPLDGSKPWVESAAQRALV